MPGGFDSGFDFGFGSPVLSDDDIGLFVRGHVVGEASVRLITVGSEQASSDFSLSILGHTVGQSDAALTIAGAGYAALDFGLSVRGHFVGQSGADLTIAGAGCVFSGLDLFLRTVEAVSGRGDLFIAGETQPAFGSAPFWLHGADLPSGPSCPALDPMASIQISDDLIRIYQSRIDALINQLGKNVYLEFDPIRDPCPNCEYDAVRKRSKGIYVPGGPRPFPRGRRCPYCKGAGFLEMAVETCIKCLLKWNPRDAVNFGMSVSDTKGIVRLKTYLDNAPGIMRANTALVHRDVSGVLWNGSGSPVHVNTIPNESGTLKASFTYDTAVKTQNGLCTIHDRVSKDNDPSGVTAYVAQLVNPTSSGVGEVAGSGVDPTTGSAQPWNVGEDGWIQCHGSGQTLKLLNSPGESGLHADGDNTSGTRHDWYFALSASPDSIGSKTSLGIYLELEYL